MKKSGMAVLAILGVIRLAPQGWAQAVVATDETMKIQAVEITNWNMGDDAGGLGAGQDHFMSPNFAWVCSKVAAVTASIHSDPIPGVGRPEVYSLIKMRNMPDGPWGQGGELDFQCYGNANVYFFIHHERSTSATNQSYGSIFWNASHGLGGYGYTFSSPSARRGWIKVEYWQ